MWLAATGVSAAVWLAFWALMSWLPGDHTWATAAFAGALIGVLFALRQSPPVAIATWEAGALGEEQTAKQLRRLEGDGWVVLHDLANGSANFDHVVLGPAGVFCLNSKWSSYRLEESKAGRLVGRHEYDEPLTLDVDAVLKKVRGEAAALSRQIQDRCGHRVWVTPVVVWWGQVFNGGKLVDGVGVVAQAPCRTPARPARTAGAGLRRRGPGAPPRATPPLIAALPPMRTAHQMLCPVRLSGFEPPTPALGERCSIP